jgi:hypothetical protein
MHLTDALISTDGAILAEGSIEFPPDSAGIFASAAHDHLIIDPTGPLNTRIRPATAVRDTATGYMRAQAVGGWLSLPAPLDFELRRGLRRLVLRPIEARADHAEGMLASSSDPLTAKDQKLGHCVLEIALTPETAEFTVTADLRAALPFPDWNTSARNHWGGDGPAARLSARFSINAATACLGCGAMDPSGSPIAERSVYPFDGHDNVLLERSVVDGLGGLLAGSRNGQAWRIYTGLPGPRSEREEVLSLRRARLHRRENGLFEADEDAHWTFRCTAFTLESILRLMRRGRTLELSASGGGPATLQTGFRDETQFHSVESVTLSATATPAGVAVDMEASLDRSEVPGPRGAIRIDFVVPRETLLARYPDDHSKLYERL